MRSRIHFIRGIAKSLGEGPITMDETINAIEALLVSAATIANKASSNSVGFSQSHIEESASEMAEVLYETFGLERQTNGTNE